MKKKFLACLLSGTACLLQSAAFNVYAQSNTTNKTGAFIGANVSYNFAKFAVPKDYTLTSSKKNAPGFELIAGYEIDPNFGVEVSYSGIGNFKFAGVASDASAYNVKGRVNIWSGRLVYTVTEGAPGLFLMAGITKSKVTTSVKEKGTGYLFGIGYKYKIDENVSATVGYTRYQRLGGNKNNNLDNISAGVRYAF